MSPEKQRIAIAEVCGLKIPTEQEKSAMGRNIDNYSWYKFQCLVKAWVCTHKTNPHGVWIRGGCSQAVRDKSVAEKWQKESRPPEEHLVVEVDAFLDVPDYLNELNAMHEAEKVLTRDQRQVYANLLWPTGYSVQDAIMASASQRAEAFLKTLGLWTEG